MRPFLALAPILRALAALLLVSGTLAHAADPPRVIHYQGVLKTPAGAPVLGPVDVQFELFTTPTGGGAFWRETHTNLTTVNGAFSVRLGSIVPLTMAFDQAFYLGIKVGNDPDMTPRQPLSSVPYALNAPFKRSIHGCFPGQANHNGGLYEVTYTASSKTYAVLILQQFATPGYTVLLDARTSKGRSYALTPSAKAVDGITLTGGWLDDDGETVATVCFLMAE